MQINRELSAQIREIVHEENLKLLMDIYRFMAIKTKIHVPDIAVLHNIFKEKWIDKNYEFLITNADAYEFDLEQISKHNHIAKLEEVGFILLELDDVERIFNSLNISFVRNGVLWNSAVISVW
jgi:hypothetical protein